MTNTKQRSFENIQEQLKDSITFKAEEKVILEKIVLDVDASERGNVYQGSETELYNMYSSHDFKDTSPIKMRELLPWSEVNGMSRSYMEPDEYIALYLYGDKDEYGNMSYALQWGDVFVKVDKIRLEQRGMKVVKNRAYTSDGEWLEMLVLYDSEVCPYVFVKQGDDVVEYVVRGYLYSDMLHELYQLEVSGSDLIVYTHNAILRVRGRDENEWDDITFGNIDYWSSDWTIRISIEAGESYTTHDGVALLVGDIYLDVDKEEFTFKNFKYFASQNRKITLTACSKGVDRQAESNDTTTVSEYHSEALKTVPQFLIDFADEVVVDEKDFELWETESGYWFYKGWEDEGFAPCEIVLDGTRCKGIYTEAGTAVIGVEQKDASPRCMVVYKDKSMMLDGDISAVFLDNCLTVYFHDFDNDGNDELLVCDLKSDGMDNIAVIKLETFEKMTFKFREPDDFVPLAEMSITDVTWVDKDKIEYTFNIQDHYGNEYNGWSWYSNYADSYIIPENDEYFVDHWLNLGFVAKEDKIWDTVCPYMQNNGSYVLSPFATLHIYYVYDSEEQAFVSDTAILNFKNPPEDGKIADKEEEVEIKGRE